MRYVHLFNGHESIKQEIDRNPDSFGWAMSATMARPSTLLEDTKFRLEHHRAPNKGYLKLIIGILYLVNATNGHIGAHTIKTRGAGRSGCTPTTLKLLSTLLKQTILYIFRRLMFSYQYIWYLKAHESINSEIDQSRDTLVKPILDKYQHTVTTSAHTDFGLQDHRAPNIWYWKVYNVTIKTHKVTSGQIEAQTKK